MKGISLEQAATSPDSIRLAEKANLTGGFLIGRVKIEGTEHKIPIPTEPRATKLGRKGGYALFYDGIPKDYNTVRREKEGRSKLEDIDPDAVYVLFPNYNVYNGHSSRFITYGKHVFY